MKASCRKGHLRESMYFEHINNAWRCPVCCETLTAHDIAYATPEAYRLALSGVVRMLQIMADYEIEGILNENGRIEIEYPRPSLER